MSGYTVIRWTTGGFDLAEKKIIDLLNDGWTLGAFTIIPASADECHYQVMYKQPQPYTPAGPSPYDASVRRAGSRFPRT